jgi:hypothetical protein
MAAILIGRLDLAAKSFRSLFANVARLLDRRLLLTPLVWAGTSPWHPGQEATVPEALRENV